MKLQAEGDSLDELHRRNISGRECKRKCVHGYRNTRCVCADWRRIGGSDVVML